MCTPAYLLKAPRPAWLRFCNEEGGNTFALKLAINLSIMCGAQTMLNMVRKNAAGHSDTKGVKSFLSGLNDPPIGPYTSTSDFQDGTSKTDKNFRKVHQSEKNF